MGHKRKRIVDPDSTTPQKKQDYGSPNITRGDHTSVQKSLVNLPDSLPHQYPPEAPVQNSQSNSYHGIQGNKGGLIPGPVPSYSPSSPSPSFPQLPPVPPGYLSTAPFVHASIMTTSRITAAADSSYERLEWLGDAYIEIISSRILYSRFPNFPANKLAHTRERLVCNKNLARFSRKYGFDRMVKCAEYLRADSSFIKIVADVFEAYTAAIVQGDPLHGFATAEAWLSALWEPQLREVEKLERKPILAGNAKEELRTMIMSPGVKIEYLEERPAYVNKAKGETTFWICCYVTGWGYEKKRIGTGTGNAKVVAGNNAASNALEKESILLQDMAARKKIFDEKRKQEKEAELAHAQEGQPDISNGHALVSE